AAIFDKPRPHWAIADTLDMRLDILIRSPHTAALFSEMRERQAHALFHILVRPVSEFAVGDRREVHDYIADAFVIAKRRVPRTVPFLVLMGLQTTLIKISYVGMGAVLADSVLGHQRPVGNVLV